jgi:predicted  nucleic acid-binding Zn-ribbon protein
MDILGLNRLGQNCNKLIFEGSADLSMEILALEKRNFELEEEIGLLKSSTENQMTELQNDVKKNLEEVVMLKAQLEETIVAADKCIEELEEQVTKHHFSF